MDESMNTWVLTRSGSLDYAFLGSAPANRWWERYTRSIDSTKRGAAVESADGTWQVYLTGIPSRRRDKVGTPIRYTLVLSGKTTDGLATEQALRVISNWLSNATASNLNSLSAALDGQFDDETIASLQRRRDSEAAAEASHRLHEVFTALPREGLEEPVAPPVEYTRWIGDLSRSRAQAGWLAQVTRILTSEPGHALVLNLTSNEAELEYIPDGPLAVLLTDPNPPLMVPTKMKQPRPEPPTGENCPKVERARPSRLARIVRDRRTPIAIMAGLLLCLVIWLIRFLVN
jgi:hypothetical protein